MTARHFDIGVIVARRALASPWADRAWLPYAVLPAAPPVAPWTRLGGGTGELFYAGPAVLTLHSGEAAHYRDNLLSGRPSLWVLLQFVNGDACAVSTVTADPYEGEALTENIGGLVEALPMPKEIGARIAAFVAAFHVERPFVKRQRDRADPEALGRRRPAASAPRTEER